MNMLLLLSAFLSALTGAITGTRVPAVQLHQAVAESRIVQRVAVRSAAAAVRPANSIVTLVESSRASMAPMWSLADSVPLYAERRRE